MVFHPERTAIVGATGPTGLHLARELVSPGRQVRVVSRRRDHLKQVFAGQPVEIATADALDAESLARTRPCPGPRTPPGPGTPGTTPVVIGVSADSQPGTDALVFRLRESRKAPSPLSCSGCSGSEGRVAAGGFSWTPDLAELNAEAVAVTLDWLVEEDRS